jgi:hypothetical protein
MIRAFFWAVCAIALAGCATLTGHTRQIAKPEAGSAALHVECANAVVVGLSWDPASLTHSGWMPWRRNRTRYTISRDGSPIGTTSETNFTDATVAASTSYDYSVSVASASGESVTAATVSRRLSTPAASPIADAPYCNSRYIDSVSWDWTRGHTEPNGSDLWPVTWGRDGKVYTFFGDGGGFGGDNYRGRASFGVATLPSAPPFSATTARNIYGGYQAAHPSTVDGKAGSIIAVGKDFYTLGGLYEAQELAGISGHKSGAPKRVQLAYSKGNAHSWRAADWVFCSRGRQTAVGAFCPVGFVNYGRGNAGAPDDNVYLLGFANSAAWWEGDDGPEILAERGQNPNVARAPNAAAPQVAAAEGSAHTFLARVPRKHVLQHDAYRYFAGLDAEGRPIWSADQRQMQPIFTDRNPKKPGCGGLCDMTSPLESAVYNTGIGRYIATAQGGFVGQTSFYDAPQPWGPWTTIAYNNIDPQTGTGGWANLGSAGGGSLGVHVINAWTSPDGLSLWLTYSSDGTAPPGASFPPAGTKLDSFNLVNAHLIMAKRPGDPH